MYPQKGGGPFLLWLQKPCKVTSTTSTDQDHHKNSQVQGKVADSSVDGQTFWNHHTLFKYRSKYMHKHAYTQFLSSFQLLGAMNFQHDSNMLLELLLPC